MKKIEKTIFGCLLAVFAVTLAAKEEVLLQSDFAANRTLKGWIDMAHASPPHIYAEMSPKNSEQYKVVSENGNAFMRTAPIYFGISRKFSKPVTIDGTVKSITLKVTLLQPKKEAGHTITPTLSSRVTVVHSTGQAFEQEKDSGVYVSGYGHNSQMSNYVGYRVDGKEIIRSSPPKSPYNLLSGWDQWETWTLVYDNQKKTLEFFGSADSAGPRTVLYNVKMDGVTLNCLWLPAWGACYKNVRVTVERK